MALDEPKEEDTLIDCGGYKILLDSQVEGIARRSGGLQIDYVDEAHRRGYLVKLSGGKDCGSGNCNC